jgi:cell division cycle protein 20 (cofactor of APC complex)
MSASTTPGGGLGKSPHGNRSVKLSFNNKTPGQKVRGFGGGARRNPALVQGAAQLCHAQMDRFIPTRSAMDLDMANMQLSKENAGAGGEGGPGSPGTDEYQRALAGQLGVDAASRILAFKQKAPAPPEGHENNLRSLYTENLGPAPNRKQFRCAHNF